MSTASFVEQLFSRFLGRSADLAGRDYWVSQIDSGAVTAAGITQFLLDSSEYNGVVAPVARLYYAAFGRIPDAGGLNYWVTAARAGATMAQISSDFVRSAEFASLYGSNVADSKFVDLLYQNVLGRAGDAGGKAYWLARLTTDKAPRSAVLSAFADSPELISNKGAEIKVVGQYQSLLGITPSKADLALALKLDPTQLTTQLYASDSYTGVPAPYLNAKGTAVDGYLGKATVFVDQNGNHQLDADEISSVANLQGDYSFKGRENYNGVLIAQGGQDLSTGQMFDGQLSAPAGSSVITPLTTLLQTMEEQSTLDLGVNAGILREHFELDAALDITHFDPIAQAVKSGASMAAQTLALKVQLVNSQINTIISQAVAFLSGTGVGTDATSAARAAYQALADIVLDPTQASPIDLTSVTTIQLILSNSAHLLHAEPDQQALVNQWAGGAAMVISDLTSALADASGMTALATLTKIAQIQYVAIDIGVNLQAGVVNQDLTAVLAQLTPDALGKAVDAAATKIGPVVQDLIAPTLMSSNPANKGGPVAADSNIVLTFSEPVAAGSGNIMLVDAFESRVISVSDASQVSIAGNTVTINPTLDLHNGSTYAVKIDPGAIVDTVQNPFAGIKDTTTLSFGVPNKAVGLFGVNGTTGSRFDAVSAAGMSVSAAGDVNGDGYADFLIGSSAANNTGSSFLLFGKAAGFTAITKLSSLSSTSGVRFDGVTAGDFSGGSVAGVGDINRDGFADIAIGANTASPGGKAMAGSVYVVQGKTSGFAATNKLSALDGKTGFRIDGDSANGLLGSAVAGAGDVNGDGLPDIVIGANGLNSNAGGAYVVFGKAAARTATMNVSTLDGSNGFRISGVESNDNTGFAVSSAGDVNGDGYADLLIGAFSANRGAGAAYLVYGKAGGFTANLDLSKLDGTNGVRFNGADGDNAGRSVAKLGDINGDGIDDFVLGAFHGNGDTGAAYVVFGKNGAFDASVDLATLDGKNGFRVNGVAAQDVAGIAVSGAGDVNGDGLGDLIVGARDSNGRAGSSYVVYGSRDGFSAQLNMADLNGVNGFRLFGNTGDLSGVSVAGVGDVNGDGFADLLVGAQGLANVAGSSYLVFGSNTSNVVQILGTTVADKLNGTDKADGISGGAGDDIITGLGGADLIHGGAGKDRIVVPDLTFRLVDGGGGLDTLALSGAGLNLNLAQFHSKISSIETIELIGSGDNEITIAAADVLAISGQANTLTISGNAGDAVHLSGAWVSGAIASGLHTYTLGNVTVLIGTALTVDVMM
jgi:methionine-rich copper-binding protein CopC